MKNPPMLPETSTSPLVSISIVSHGQTILVKRLLQSISEHEDDRKLEIILTENIPSEIVNIKQLNYPNLRQVLNPKPKGFGANHNQASKIARGEYFCILNPDAVFTENLFSQLMDDLESGNGDIVAPLIVNSSGQIQDSFRQIPTPMEILTRRLQPGNTTVVSQESGTIRPDWIAGIFMLLRLQIFKKLAGFNENYYLYFEDVDFCSRARLAGLKLRVATHSRIEHDGMRLSRNNLRYMILHLISAVRFFTSPVYKEAKKITDAI